MFYLLICRLTYIIKAYLPKCKYQNRENPKKLGKKSQKIQKKIVKIYQFWHRNPIISSIK